MPLTTLDPQTALVVIDLQKIIVAMAPAAAEVVPHAARLAKAFRAAHLPVVLVTVHGAADGGDSLRTRTTAPARPLPHDPEHVAPVPELGPEPGDILVQKRNWGAFYGTALDLHLRRRGVTGIVLCGVSTSIGVDTTARQAHERGYNLTFARDAMADLDPASHEHELTKLFPRMGEIDTTDAILATLARTRT